MNNPSSDRSRGDLLRSLREAQNLDVAEVARLVNLSSGQVFELESGELTLGGRSLFYTVAIKEKAASKLAQVLGADAKTLWGNQALPAKHSKGGLPDLQILDDLADLLKKQSQARELSSGERFFSWKWATALFAALWLAGAVGFYGQAVTAWFQSQKIFETFSAPAPTPVAVDAKSPDSTPSEVPPAHVVSQTTEMAASVAETLCDSQVSQTTVTPSQPSKAGNSVHLVALEDLSMCIIDGAGKKTPLTLKAQESKTILGKSPWHLHIDKIVSMQMFFQGQKIYWPDGEPRALLLKEVPGEY